MHRRTLLQLLAAIPFVGSLFREAPAAPAAPPPLLNNDWGPYGRSAVYVRPRSGPELVLVAGVTYWPIELLQFYGAPAPAGPAAAEFSTELNLHVKYDGRGCTPQQYFDQLCREARDGLDCGIYLHTAERCELQPLVVFKAAELRQLLLGEPRPTAWHYLPYPLPFAKSEPATLHDAHARQSGPAPLNDAHIGAATIQMVHATLTIGTTCGEWQALWDAPAFRDNCNVTNLVDMRQPHFTEVGPAVANGYGLDRFQPEN